MPSPFVHLELTTPDLKKAKDFYGQLCGWTFNDAPMPHRSIHMQSSIPAPARVGA